MTLAVPAYNSEAYLERCVDSLLATGSDDIEVVIVNDGSKDGTRELADRYQREHPGKVIAVHKENGGHGSAINAGLRHASGVYFKVVDSDDWLDADAFEQTLAKLRESVADDRPLDLLITNFVYEKQDKRVKRVVDYGGALPRGREFGWDDVGHFRLWQYLLMHSLIYRTELLRECGLHVPEHSFYVDNYFAFVPLPEVKRLSYLDVDLYRYFIGRSDQSVNEKVMIGRIDQQININLLMVTNLSRARSEADLPDSLLSYMTRYAALLSTVTSALLARDRSPESLAKLDSLWHQIKQADPHLHEQMLRVPVARLAANPSAPARWALRNGYDVARLVVGFN